MASSFVSTLGDVLVARSLAARQQDIDTASEERADTDTSSEGDKEEAAVVDVTEGQKDEEDEDDDVMEGREEEEVEDVGNGGWSRRARARSAGRMASVVGTVVSRIKSVCGEWEEARTITLNVSARKARADELR